MSKERTIHTINMTVQIFTKRGRGFSLPVVIVMLKYPRYPKNVPENSYASNRVTVVRRPCMSFGVSSAIAAVIRSGSFIAPNCAVSVHRASNAAAIATLRTQRCYGSRITGAMDADRAVGRNKAARTDDGGDRAGHAE